jgi:hypothetical protein
MVLALASITDPSGHVLVVGDVGGTDVDGGVIVGGINVCVHDGSFGYFVQSTSGGEVPVVQLFMHVDPVPGPPDAGIDVLVGCIAADLLLGGGVAAAVVVLVRLLLAPLTLGSRGAHFNPATVSSFINASDIHFVYALSDVSGKSLAQANPPLSSFATSAADIHFVYALGSIGGHGPV